jgi:UDP-N-acetylmuramyl-tripeptide synthetase
MDGAQLSVELHDLAKAIGGTVVNSPAYEVLIRGVVFSGRHSLNNSIFVAIKGSAADGHQFISHALENGSGAAVVTDAAPLAGAPGILVADTRKALSRLAAIFAGEPSREMQVVGVTGTNGKTTINWLVYNLLEKCGISSMRIGTLGIKARDLFDSPGNLTTPDPVQIQESMALALAAGVRACVLETSSHALDQYRVDDLQFDVGIFTNLTRDHLDYHGDMESYFLAKRRLYDLIAGSNKKTRAASINLDDEFGQRLQAYALSLGLADFSYGRDESARIRILGMNQDLKGSVVRLQIAEQMVEIKSALIGGHNASNIAAAFAAGLALGLNADQMAEAFLSMPQVPGRLEAVGAERFGVYVDYAHTPDALDNTLRTLAELKRGALWVIFGCGGDRDRGKRPQMARVAMERADRVVVTSDNPRTEDPMTIIGDILSEGCRPVFVEADRRKAINMAVRELKEGDILLIAGKGHEDYQIIGKEKIHFSDVEEAARAISSRNASEASR